MASSDSSTPAGSLPLSSAPVVSGSAPPPPASTVGLAAALGTSSAPATAITAALGTSSAPAPALTAAPAASTVTLPLYAAPAIGVLDALASTSSAPAATSFTAPAVPAAPAPPVTAQSLQHIRIRDHVPVTLDLKQSNHGRWTAFFNVIFFQFGLVDHITDHAEHMIGDPEWLKVDFTIVSWLYTTISADVLNIILSPQDSAYVVWTKIRSLFLDNLMTQAVYMEEEFRSLQQGDLSVSDYCSRLKTLADGLRDIGVQITDQSMLFNMLRGLGPALGHAVPVLTMQQPLPSFMRARSFLLLEEHRLEQTARRQAASALYAGGPRSASPTPASPTSGKKNKKGKEKKTGNGSTSTQSPGDSSRSAPAPSPWIHGVHPWAGTFQAWQHPQAWQRPPGDGILRHGPRPPMTPTAPHAYAAAHLPHLQTTSAASSSSSQLDPNLLAAMQQLQPPSSSSGGGDWFLDTGASAHMTSQPGSSYQGGDSSQ